MVKQDLPLLHVAVVTFLWPNENRAHCVSQGTLTSTGEGFKVPWNCLRQQARRCGVSSRQTGFLEMNVGKHKGSLLVPHTSVSAGLMNGNREASCILQLGGRIPPWYRRGAEAGKGWVWRVPQLLDLACDFLLELSTDSWFFYEPSMIDFSRLLLI